MNSEKLKSAAVAEIDRRADDIIRVSDHIMRNPETGFRELRTAEFVAGEFDRMDVPYRGGLAVTGVKGRLRGRSEGPTVAIMGELDSLIAAGHPFADPVTQAAHACGHNAQVAAMLGAGLGLRTVMDHLDGDVVLFAVPAEELIEIDWRLGLRSERAIEFLVGKAELIRLGEFDDVDMAMMTHTPASRRDELASVGGSHNGGIVKYAEFLGKAAHAAGAPWLGINAMKAAMIASTAIDAQRDTHRDQDFVRAHFIMPEGGDPMTAVPAAARLEGMVRGKTNEAIRDANRKVDRSLHAGALALGARLEITTLAGFLPYAEDANLVSLMHANCASVVGEDNVGSAWHRTGSTDIGDLAHIMPVVHPYSGGVTGATHSNEYHVVDHRLAAVNPAKWMAMTVIDLLCDGAHRARGVTAEAGLLLTREEYVKLRRSYDYQETYDGAAHRHFSARDVRL